MAHLEQYGFCRRVYGNFHPLFRKRRVLGVGTRDINSEASGYDVEALFSDCEMTGLDLDPGPHVTHVCHAADFSPGATPGFDVVYSCEALEHDRRWRETVRAMVRFTRPGGLMFITTAGPGREEHGTTAHHPHVSPATNDYYGNLEREELAEALGVLDNFSSFAFEEWRGPRDLYFWGIRR